VSDHTRRALGGFILLLPAFTLVVSGLLRLNPPAELLHPLVVLLGLAAALVLNLPAAMSAKIRRGSGSLLGGVAIQVRGRLLNLAVLGLGFLIGATIALYLFVENFKPR
jgi:hypothetical protein